MGSHGHVSSPADYPGMALDHQGEQPSSRASCSHRLCKCGRYIAQKWSSRWVDLWLFCPHEVCEQRRKIRLFSGLQVGRPTPFRGLGVVGRTQAHLRQARDARRGHTKPLQKTWNQSLSQTLRRVSPHGKSTKLWVAGRLGCGFGSSWGQAQKQNWQEELAIWTYLNLSI